MEEYNKYLDLNFVISEYESLEKAITVLSDEVKQSKTCEEKIHMSICLGLVYLLNNDKKRAVLHLFTAQAWSIEIIKFTNTQMCEIGMTEESKKGE